MKQKAVILNYRDNVATSLANLKAGDTLELEVSGKNRAIKLTTDVPFGHKFSLSRIEPNSPVIKYGEVIGIATAFYLAVPVPLFITTLLFVIYILR